MKGEIMKKEDLIKLGIEAQKKIDDDNLEKIVCRQADASLRSPGVPAHYYRFFYFLTKIMKPKLCVELGTHTGISSACLAEGNPQGKVITVNHHDQLSKECRRDNIEYLIQDSYMSISLPGKIDILFIDTDHDGIRCGKEYEIYKDMIKPGGLVFFDDIHLFPCMDNFWNGFNPCEGEKFELEVHGKAGFGVVIFKEA